MLKHSSCALMLSCTPISHLVKLSLPNIYFRKYLYFYEGSCHNLLIHACCQAIIKLSIIPPQTKLNMALISKNLILRIRFTMA